MPLSPLFLGRLVMRGIASQRLPTDGAETGGIPVLIGATSGPDDPSFFPRKPDVDIYPAELFGEKAPSIFSPSRRHGLDVLGACYPEQDCAEYLGTVPNKTLIKTFYFFHFPSSPACARKKFCQGIIFYSTFVEKPWYF